jgi:hypothetical protein
MMRAHARPGSTDAAPLHVRVVGPESALPSAADVRRLFARGTLTRARREHLHRCARVVAMHGAHVLGLAAFERANDDIRVHELAVDPSLAVTSPTVLHRLLDALELACLASGARRILLVPQAVAAATPLERLGYRVVNEGCAGAWLEKTFR